MGPSSMLQEIREIPEAARRLMAPDRQGQISELASRLQTDPPRMVLTVARGSSDHAATVLAYAIGILTGLPVASFAPSLASIHGAAIRAEGGLVLAVSQSGKSMDLTSAVSTLSAGGARTIAITNSADSPLAGAVGDVLDIAAGPEHTVAATKSYLSSIVCGLSLVAHWTGDAALEAALQALPERLEGALQPAAEIEAMLTKAEHLVVIGRGPTLGVAQEVALKAMELCGIHASAYSAAEVLHGPAQILQDGFPVLSMGAPTGARLDDTLGTLRKQGAFVVEAPTSEPLHDVLDGLLTLVPVYLALEAAARARGHDPDRPPLLRKETLTL